MLYDIRIVDWWLAVLPDVLCISWTISATALLSILVAVVGIIPVDVHSFPVSFSRLLQLTKSLSDILDQEMAF